MPQKVKVASRCDSHSSEYFHSNPKYCQRYFDIVDNTAGIIVERFHQSNYSICIKYQNILLKVSYCQNFRSELNSLEDLYKENSIFSH